MDISALESYRHYTTTSSGPVSYLDMGNGHPAVFIHGIVTNALLWRHTLASVASNTRRCVAIDLPGHGHTPPAPPNSNVSLKALAHQIIEVCDTLGLDTFDLVVNDTGGAIGQIIAAHLGARLTSLTFTDCDTEGNTPPKLFRPFITAARLGLMSVVGPHVAASDFLMRRVLRVSYRYPNRLDSDVLHAYFKPVFGSSDSVNAFERLLGSVSNDDLAAVRTDLAQLNVPTLIVWGNSDPLFHVKWAHRLRDLIPGTTAVRIIAGGKTHFPDERADEFTPLLEQHWASTAVTK